MKQQGGTEIRIGRDSAIAPILRSAGKLTAVLYRVRTTLEVALESSRNRRVLSSEQRVSTSCVHARLNCLTSSRALSGSRPARSVLFKTFVQTSSGQTLIILPPNRLRTLFSSRSIVPNLEVMPMTHSPGVYDPAWTASRRT